MKRSGIRRASAMKRQKSLTSAAIQRRRAKITTEEKETREIVRERSGGICEKCQVKRATNMHHRVKAGRKWTPSNIIHVCGMGNNFPGCHRDIEADPDFSKDQGWWLLPIQDPARTPVWLAGREFVFLADDGSIHDTDEEAA